MKIIELTIEEAETYGIASKVIGYRMVNGVPRAQVKWSDAWTAVTNPKINRPIPCRCQVIDHQSEFPEPHMEIRV